MIEMLTLKSKETGHAFFAVKYTDPNAVPAFIVNTIETRLKIEKPGQNHAAYTVYVTANGIIVAGRGNFEDEDFGYTEFLYDISVLIGSWIIFDANHVYFGASDKALTKYFEHVRTDMLDANTKIIALPLAPEDAEVK